MGSSDKSTIGNVPLDELKEIIRSVIKEEALQSHIPLLRLHRGKTVKRWLLVGIIAFIIGLLGYRTFFYESSYGVIIDKGDLYIVKTIGWRTDKQQIKVVDNKWQLRYDFEGKQLWSPIYTPFETRYNDYYKFIFAGRGNLFWVSNDKTSIRPVRLVDGEWKFQSDLTNEWIEFPEIEDDNY